MHQDQIATEENQRLGPLMLNLQEYDQILVRLKYCLS